MCEKLESQLWENVKTVTVFLWLKPWEDVAPPEPLEFLFQFHSSRRRARSALLILRVPSHFSLTAATLQFLPSCPPPSFTIVRLWFYKPLEPLTFPGRIFCGPGCSAKPKILMGVQVHLKENLRFLVGDTSQVSSTLLTPRLGGGKSVAETHDLIAWASIRLLVPWAGTSDLCYAFSLSQDAEGQQQDEGPTRPPFTKWKHCCHVMPAWAAWHWCERELLGTDAVCASCMLLLKRRATSPSAF